MRRRTEKSQRVVTSACRHNQAYQGFCLCLPGGCTIARSLLFCVEGKRAAI